MRNLFRSKYINDSENRGGIGQGNFNGVNITLHIEINNNFLYHVCCLKIISTCLKDQRKYLQIKILQVIIFKH
jgi:hypothetical protein